MSDHGVTAPIRRRFHEISAYSPYNFLNSKNLLLLRHICHHGFQTRGCRPGLENAKKKKDGFFKEQRCQLKKV